MTLEVDLSDTSQMEQRNYGRYENRIPALIRSKHAWRLTQAREGTKPPHGQDTKDSDRERSVGKKTVTMAPNSRCMTGRSLYTPRKPLISAEHQISILKNPLTHESSESVTVTKGKYFDKVHVSNVASNQKESEEIDCNKSDKCTREDKSVPQIIASFPSLSREDISTSLSILDLRLCSSGCEDPSFSPVPSANKCESWNLSSPPLDELDLTVPLNPKWTSTQRTFSHSYTSYTSPFQKTKTRALKQERDSSQHLVSRPSYNKGSSSELKLMSPYQANYWACAIPRCLPPSPDRKSPSWDPDKEYQNLLDYTYPLRPNMTHTRCSNTRRSLLQNEVPLPDSGIELDSFLSSSSISCFDQPWPEIRHVRSGSAQRFQSLNLRKPSQSKSSEVRLSSSPYSSMEQMGLSMESLDSEGNPNMHYRKSGLFSTSRSLTFLRSACLLPSPGSLGEWDEEFLRLPDQLQELQDLSQQLKDLTVQISQPFTTSCESLERDSASVRPSGTQLEKPAAKVSTGQENKDHGSVMIAPLQSEELSVQTEGLDATLPVIRGQMNRGSQREMETIMDQMTTSLSELERRTGPDEVEEENRESVLQNLQAFCSNLEKLIRWLHRVTEKMEVLCPPLVDIESVKVSLADYEGFQKEVQAHRPLTASVLQTGEMLLCCMNSASPFLKETLMLIEKQSHALETHSEHLFSSILSAMDSLAAENTQNSTAGGTSGSPDLQL